EALVEGLAGAPAPVEAVGIALQIEHADPMIFRIAARIAGDRHDVAGPQRLVRDPLARQLPGPAPLDGPALRLPVLVRRLDVHERVRIAEHELEQLPLDLDRPVLEVSGRERVMRGGGCACERENQCCGDLSASAHVLLPPWAAGLRTNRFYYGPASRCSAGHGTVTPLDTLRSRSHEELAFGRPPPARPALAPLGRLGRRGTARSAALRPRVAGARQHRRGRRRTPVRRARAPR